MSGVEMAITAIIVGTGVALAARLLGWALGVGKVEPVEPKCAACGGTGLYWYGAAEGWEPCQDCGGEGENR